MSEPHATQSGSVPMPNSGRDYAQNVYRAARQVRAWPFGHQRAAARLTPEHLRQSAKDMERGPDTPEARRLLAAEMEFRGIAEATPGELVEMWKSIPR